MSKREKIRGKVPLLIEIKREHRDAFKDLCERHDTSMGREIRKFIFKTVTEKTK